MSEAAVIRHVLPGLRPDPLASYLAGIGLIRLLGEQADAAAAAAWTDDGLAISTTVGDLATWLADEYIPTPVLSPWNNGSGFGAKDKEPKRTLDALRAHPSPRLEHLRAAIPVAERVSKEARDKGWLGDSPKSGDKGRAVQEFRNWCPDVLLPWIDATVVLGGEEPIFPPLLGTGGNDGRLDFSTNFHQRLLDVLDVTDKGRARSLASAQDLLTGTETQPLADAAVGQFDPGAAGGPGSSPFGAAGSRVNPWGYVLLVEGTLLFAASTVRRHEHGGGRAAIPFTVYSSPDGSATGAEGEESRGEIWVPVWRTPFTLAEIRQLFGEARASWRGHPARRAVEFYAATRTLGVARGVDEFVRYGLHRRNGLAYAATPVDRFDVRSNSNVRLVASVEDWPARLRSDLSSGIQMAMRQFEAAHLKYARNGQAIDLARMLASLTTLEQVVGRSSRTRDNVAVRRPPSAQPFLDVLAAKESSELRIAVGLASCATVPGPDPARTPARTMRRILLPVDPPGPGEQARSAGRWRDTPLVAGLGVRPLGRVLADVLAWRSRTAGDEPDQEAFRGVPTFRRGIPVPAMDLHAFARGQLDEAELDLWLRACLALDWRGVQRKWSASDTSPGAPVPTLGLLHPFARGLAMDRGESGTAKLGLRPDWANRLAAGQIPAVHNEAVARLRQAGWLAVPYPPCIAAGKALTDPDGSRLAAALVPRCSNDETVLLMLAIRARTDDRDGGEQEPPTSDVDAAAANDPSQYTTPQLIEESK